MSWYYRIWIDAINFEIKKNNNTEGWRVFTFCYMTVFLAWNIAALYSAILFFTGFDFSKLIKDKISYFPSDMLNNIAWAVISLFVPSILIIYLLIFYNNRYELLLSKYEYKKGKLLATYFFTSIILIIGFSLLNKFFK